MAHDLAVSEMMTVLAYPTLLFLGLAAVACGVLTIWPRFRSAKSLLRVCGVLAAGVVVVTAWSKEGPQRAAATPVADAEPLPRVVEVPSENLLLKGSPTTRPLPATVMDIEGRSFLVAELPKTSPARRAGKGSIALLGPTYTDEINGFSVRFPAGWQIKTFAASGSWILDAAKGNEALISVGFAPFPKNVRAEQIKPELMAESIRSQPETMLHGQGAASVDGRAALWAHSTGPLATTGSSPRMTRVHYLVPLQDGRALELRLAAVPEKYDQLAPVMKQAAESFKLIPKAAK